MTCFNLCSSEQVRIFFSEVLENLELQELVCLDDLQAVIGNLEWEIAIFDLINRIREVKNVCC